MFSSGPWRTWRSWRFIFRIRCVSGRRSAASSGPTDLSETTSSPLAWFSGCNQERSTRNDGRRTKNALRLQVLLRTQDTPLSQHHPARTSPRPPADAAHAGSHAPAAASSCVSSYTYLVPILSFYHSTPRILDSWTPGAPSHLNPRPLESSTPSCSSHNTNRLFWTKCAMIQHSGSPP
jgi:hypothetical protein